MDDILSQGEIDALMRDYTECDIHNIEITGTGCPQCFKDKEEHDRKVIKLLKTIRGWNAGQHWTVESLTGSIHKLIDASELLPNED